MTERVVVGRFDNNRPIELEPNMNINQALQSAGFIKADNEEVQDIDGNKYTGTEDAEPGLAYFLVERVKSGC